MASRDSQPPKKHPPGTIPVAPSTLEELRFFSTEDILKELHRRHIRAVVVMIAQPNPDDENHGGDFSVSYLSDLPQAISDLKYAVRTLRES